MTEVSEILKEQYQEIAESIEFEGLGYAVLHGYISDNTEDEKLNAAVRQARKSLEIIESIIAPYTF